jgi:Fe-Mn family superoxide dismutase
MPAYTLPQLKYDYAALEPHVSGKILELHHGRHHAAYVKGANDTLEALADSRAKKDFSRIPALERALAFHISGHVMHSIFWQNMTPGGGGQPTGALAAQIDADFGSFDLFKAQLNAVSATIMGSGWGALVWEPVSKRLITTQIYDHQTQVTQGSLPLLVVDAWEHAFYLQYGPDKAKFFESLWNVWNWADVSARFEGAKNISASLTGAFA